MKSRGMSALFLVLAVALMGIGVFRGEAQEVFNKGVNLCLECVGIG